ncbi:type II secretion system protein J [Virgibacillus byunsanensis]|uniref:Type II secretion system protein J n=1 Tax=Virgibacillus byunsanensis TaxID=570945 RepID=A0ABW3LJY4_9BACI
MPFRQYHNEQGMTLVELLAAISLFAILVTLSSTIIIQLLNSEEKTSDQISLKQDTNVLVSEMRSTYYDENSILCMDTSEGRIDLVMDETSITNGNRELEINNGCVENVDHTEPLHILLTTSNKSDQNFSVKTTWTSKTDYNFSVSINEEIDFPNEVTKDNIRDGCNLSGNTSFNMNEINAHYRCIVTDGNAEFPNDLLINKGSLTLTVDGNAEFLKSISLLKNNPNNVELEVFGNAIFNGDLDFEKNKTEIYIHGDATFKGNIIFKKNLTEIFIEGQITCNREVIGENMVIEESISCSSN